ncbi:HAD family hydrolase [Candidatus Collierbacteria bacterium]|nr:HAD family hydrolase [Candidatus Collierbacteria bacterium]
MPNKLSWINQIKFLCFDLDGTLFRNVEAAWNAIQQQIYKTVMRQRHLSLEEAENYVRQRYSVLGSSTKVLNELGIDGEEFFVKAFKKIELDKFISKDDEIIQLISNLKKKYKVGMISNTHRSIARKKLEAIGLSLKEFNPLITTYELDVYKPDPAPFLKALEIASCSPEESVYIGDSVETDIMGAKAVGMKTILVWGKSPEADLSIPTIYDLAKYF